MEIDNNKIKFIERVTHAEIAASTKLELDLNDLRARYGDNFNTLSIINTDTASDIEIYLDGVKVKFISQDNGVWSFDWEYGIKYNFISIENLNAGAAIATTLVKVSVGRTGK